MTIVSERPVPERGLDLAAPPPDSRAKPMLLDGRASRTPPANAMPSARGRRLPRVLPVHAPPPARALKSAPASLNTGHMARKAMVPEVAVWARAPAWRWPTR